MRDIANKPQCYSINTATLGYKNPIEEIIDLCAEKKIGAISPWIIEFNNKNIQEISRRLKTANITLSGFCRSHYYTASTESERKKAIKINKKSLDMAAEIGAPCFVQVVGSLVEKSKNLSEARNHVKQGIKALLAHSKSVGVPLALEPLHPMTTADRSCLSSLNQAINWCDELDPDGEYNLGIALDVYHVWWDEDLEKLIQKAGKRILAFHVSDWLVNTSDLVSDRGMPGDGVIDIPLIRSWVEKTGFNGAVEIEIFSKNNWWKKPSEEIIDTCIERISKYC